jgi:hypothetical protein
MQDQLCRTQVWLLVIRARKRARASARKIQHPLVTLLFLAQHLDLIDLVLIFGHGHVYGHGL